LLADASIPILLIEVSVLQEEGKEMKTTAKLLCLLVLACGIVAPITGSAAAPKAKTAVAVKAKAAACPAIKSAKCMKKAAAVKKSACPKIKSAKCVKKAAAKAAAKKGAPAKK